MKTKIVWIAILLLAGLALGAIYQSGWARIAPVTVKSHAAAELVPARALVEALEVAEQHPVSQGDDPHGLAISLADAERMRNEQASPDFAEYAAVMNHPVLEKLAELQNLRDTVYVRAGWFHMVWKFEIFSPPPANSGYSIPPISIFETWSLVDADGFVLQEVTVSRTETGEIIQESVYDGKQFINLTFNESWPSDGKKHIFPLRYISLAAENAILKGDEVTFTETQDNGKPVWQFDIWTSFEDSGAGFSATRMVMRFDPLTGVLESGDSYRIYGEQQVLLNKDIALVLEWVDAPPDDVLRLYAEAIQ